MSFYNPWALDMASLSCILVFDLLLEQLDFFKNKSNIDEKNQHKIFKIYLGNLKFVHMKLIKVFV